MLTKLRSISREVVPVHLYGNVSIDPSAVIAPGVLLQAEGSNKIVVGAGVCIGAGTIVHAAGGNLYIEAGVCLGRGVLIIGTGSIDRDACIGVGTTAIDPHIESGVVIPPHSLLGDRSRNPPSVVEEIPSHLNEPNHPPEPVEESEDLWESPQVDKVDTSVGSSYFKVKTPQVSAPAPPTPTPTPAPTVEPAIETTVIKPPPVTAIEHKPTHTVAGRDRFEQIKRALFPNSGTNDYTT